MHIPFDQGMEPKLPVKQWPSASGSIPPNGTKEKVMKLKPKPEPAKRGPKESEGR